MSGEEPGRRRRAERRTTEQHQQGLRFLRTAAWGCRSRAGKGPRRQGEREAGRCPRLGPRGGKRYLHRPGGGEPKAAGPAPS
ncbi:hypothetical protein E2I00_016868 [Balaenoptera physalus]|uniref:Uncharacterized protein n=1 Tax=Balaenoptera physalus TaxID=9770 RepID=A0A643BWL1_BALPH|nr:hypothetical protein E2I00_016868 [Balaenoptera physalus]